MNVFNQTAQRQAPLSRLILAENGGMICLMSQFEQRYSQLNPEQKKAVDTIDGPVMVIAGPGSGKTELLSLRVANILRTVDIRPGNILCLTFTDAAAFILKPLSAILRKDVLRLGVLTAHEFNPQSFLFVLWLSLIYMQDSVDKII